MEQHSRSSLLLNFLVIISEIDFLVQPDKTPPTHTP